jgi:uncharacterized iron-regulated membrane protein
MPLAPLSHKNWNWSGSKFRGTAWFMTVSARSSPISKGIIPIHRWLSLAAAAVWCLQAVTGILIVFHWEMDDASIAAAHVATDPAALQHRIALLAPAGSGRHVVSVWTSAGFADRYDITVEDAAGSDTTVRVTGDGAPVRADGPDAPRRWIDTIVTLHQSLCLGQVGRWIIGASGLMLITNMVVGLVVAWPRHGTWTKVLRPNRRGPSVARHYSWHRALGLTGALPALLLVGAGVLLAFEDEISALIGAKLVEMPAIRGLDRVGFAQAVQVAERALPGSRLAAVTPPQTGDATYRVRLRAPGEWRRAYGASFVLIDATNGHVRGVFPAGDAPPARRTLDALFPLHTGEAGGLIGRILVLCTGLWLASMTVIGIRLWWLRRMSKRRRAII